MKNSQIVSTFLRWFAVILFQNREMMSSERCCLSSREATWSARFRVTCSCEYLSHCWGHPGCYMLHIACAYSRTRVCARLCLYLDTRRGARVFSWFFAVFFVFFGENGLTKWCFGCNLYSAGSKKDWCSPQNGTALDLVSAESGADSEEKSKNLSKLA